MVMTSKLRKVIKSKNTQRKEILTLQMRLWMIFRGWFGPFLSRHNAIKIYLGPIRSKTKLASLDDSTLAVFGHPYLYQNKRAVIFLSCQYPSSLWPDSRRPRSWAGIRCTLEWLEISLFGKKPKNVKKWSKVILVSYIDKLNTFWLSISTHPRSQINTCVNLNLCAIIMSVA